MIGPMITLCSHATARQATQLTVIQAKRKCFSGFSFAGPKKLDEIMKTELLEGKSKVEVSDMWMSYHKDKKGVFGSMLDVYNSTKIIDRAEKRYVSWTE